uniref:Ovule protein n=1 Tax=Rodentolepis nana TaxID=102285 RepID=A0A0R3THU0_RODNA
LVLKRTQLVMKGERHFKESETLDRLPLTNPEQFKQPVIDPSRRYHKVKKMGQLSPANSLSHRPKIGKRILIKSRDIGNGSSITFFIFIVIFFF